LARLAAGKRRREQKQDGQNTYRMGYWHMTLVLIHLMVHRSNMGLVRLPVLRDRKDVTSRERRS
jgi:hypothetical protein